MPGQPLSSRAKYLAEQFHETSAAIFKRYAATESGNDLMDGFVTAFENTCGHWMATHNFTDDETDERMLEIADETRTLKDHFRRELGIS